MLGLHNPDQHCVLVFFLDTFAGISLPLLSDAVTEDAGC